MSTTDSTFQNALSKILKEVFEGPVKNEGYLLNPGDPGLLRQLDTIDAAAASSRDAPGKTTVAAHVDHLHYGLTLMNRWAQGEPNPWADSDWNASWQRGVVTDEQWKTLREALRREYEAWRDAVPTHTDWNDVTAAGAISSAAHTAYHLGSIRQILATKGLNGNF